jgi:hypothetical protein
MRPLLEGCFSEDSSPINAQSPLKAQISPHSATLKNPYRKHIRPLNKSFTPNIMAHLFGMRLFRARFTRHLVKYAQKDP